MIQTLPPDANADTRILRSASLNILTAGLRIGCGLVVDINTFLLGRSCSFDRVEKCKILFCIYSLHNSCKGLPCGNMIILNKKAKATENWI